MTLSDLPQQYLKQIPLPMILMLSRPSITVRVVKLESDAWLVSARWPLQPTDDIHQFCRSEWQLCHMPDGTMHAWKYFGTKPLFMSVMKRA